MIKYPEREGRQLELKRELHNFDGLLRTTTAFLNDIGGLIVIGVADESRAVIGLSESDVERYLERIPQAICDAIEPNAPIAIRTKTIEDATVVELEVYPGSRKPYFIRSEGVLKGVYVRVGSHTKRASNEEIDELTQTSRGSSSDAQPIPGVTINDLDKHLLGQLYRKAVPDIATLRAEKLVALDPVTKQDFVTLAGVVLLHPNPNRVFPAVEALFTHFKGNSTEQIIRSIDLSAPLSTLVYQVLNLLEPLLTVATERVGPRLQASRFSIPPLAIREALLNALIHRRYSAQAPVKIALFDDRLEIFSPGNFPGPIDLTELGNGVSYYRNPIIAHLTRRLGLVERRGLGFAQILRSCKENRNPTPQIIEGSDYVKVTLYTAQGSSAIELPVELFGLKSFHQKGIPLTASIVSQALQVSPGTARSRIRQLVDLKLLIREGQGRGTRYRWR
jgi:predicted HTH transcriptional regulator